MQHDFFVLDFVVIYNIYRPLIYFNGDVWTLNVRDRQTYFFVNAGFKLLDHIANLPL